jgi:hypothetical protein
MQGLSRDKIAVKAFILAEQIEVVRAQNST